MSAVRAAALGALVAATLAAPACERRQEPAPGDAKLETVEVGAKLDAYASLDQEPVEARRAAPAGGIAGALPEGFPKDVPLPSPASLVDFAATPGEGLSVTLEQQSAPEAAVRAYEAKLRAAGFASGEGGLWSRAGRRLRVSVSDFGGAARITVQVLSGRA